MKAGSLFTGVGGFDLGFERAGIECAWQVENDPNCQSVLERHYPNVKKYKDVRNVGKRNLESIDIICGGFPCQDLSVAGKRAGFAGERSGLWFEFERIIDELRPKWVVIENVPGLLSSAKGQDFETIIRALDEFGYGVAWRVLDSQYFGVPQRRRRVFIVASLGNMRCGQVLFESESMSGDFAPSKQEREAVTSTFTVRTGTHGSGGRGNLALPDGAMTLGGQPQWVANTLAGGSSKAHSDITSGQQDGNVTVCALQARDYKGVGNQYVQEGKVIATLRSGGCGGVPSSRGEHLVTSTLRGFGHGWQGQHNDTNSVMVAQTLAGGSSRCHSDISSGQQDKNIVLCMASGQANAEMISERRTALTGLHEQPIMWQMNHASEVYRESGEISPTLQSRMGTGGNNVPLIGVRRLTPVECCRLQGFPDDWNDNVSDTQRYKQMGNAVTVNVAEWIGKRIISVD